MRERACGHSEHRAKENAANARTSGGNSDRARCRASERERRRGRKRDRRVIVIAPSLLQKRTYRSKKAQCSRKNDGSASTRERSICIAHGASWTGAPRLVLGRGHRRGQHAVGEVTEGNVVRHQQSAAVLPESTNTKKCQTSTAITMRGQPIDGQMTRKGEHPSELKA